MTEKLSRGRQYCVLAAAIILVSYIGERFFNIFVNKTREVVLFEAILFSFATLVVYLLIIASKEAKYGILIAALGFRMMPPDIVGLLNTHSLGAGVLYYVVEKLALIIFAFAILRLYKYQDKDEIITPLSIIAVLVLMPFGNDISSVISNYLLAFTGKMYASYFASFFIATVIELILLYLASQTTKGGAMFICNFQLIALTLNILRRAASIVINVSRGQHISKSYYVWIAIFAFFAAAYFLLKKKREKEVVGEVDFSQEGL